jgi:hypothetical protein
MALEPAKKLPIAQYCKFWRVAFLYPPAWGEGSLIDRCFASQTAAARVGGLRRQPAVQATFRTTWQYGQRSEPGACKPY